MKKKLYLPILALLTLFVSCFEDLDDNLNPASTTSINDFIYRGLNFFYLYKADTPQLANDAFADETAKNAFISSFESPEEIFDFLKSDQDRFSILVDNYVDLENELSGITLNNGMEYGLVFYPDDSGNIFGYVRYVLPNTDAEAKGIQRGDVFNTVNGQQLDENNFNRLLDPDSYEIGLATYDGTNILPTGETVLLTKTQYTENPIYLERTYTIEGEKVGYIMYNQFNRDFDPELNAVFGNFNAEGVTKLILDLRYNGGGSVETATDLSSMITGQFNGEIFYNEQWNDDRQDAYANPGLFNNTISNGDAINSLNLTKVYILTSGRSASASELVINGLAPYIDVVQVGDNTTGKFQASFLLYDAPAPTFSRSEANPNHTYAMLPLVFKTANAAGNTDYIDGLSPDITIRENYSNLGILGDITEPLLAEALDDIFFTNRPIIHFTPLEEVSDSNAGSIIDGIMVIDRIE
ncbi:peptidase S41 [Patiriisocius marinistellae]|uniref:Peptidase S41 n=1 Tax=Patiriisocius marinistellae TaxID=2494560 RepID=A0A5J4FXS4_9FLAO|nr:S41 family peptidase [Patiriisocius marinistellae]GEQ85982.1 peptidase S41 [Patiriisocius marinistellae]